LVNNIKIIDHYWDILSVKLSRKRITFTVVLELRVLRDEVEITVTMHEIKLI